MVHVLPEIRQELLERRKAIRYLNVTDMPMIAFPGFIVIAQHAVTGHHISQCIFIQMARSAHGLRHLPYTQLCKSSGAELMTFIEQQLGFHAGKHTNTPNVVNYPNSIAVYRPIGQYQRFENVSRG